MMLLAKFDEVLIEFQELIGEHSGEHLADVVYDTLERYSLRDKVWSSFSYLSSY
jgi:hypothetical protein